MTDDLAAFLLARIAEDEHFAREACQPRVLAECEAKRSIVDECHHIVKNHFSDDFAADDLAGKVLGFLARPYRDHPDYRPEWSPDQH